MSENDKRIAAGGCWPPPSIREALAAKNGPAKPLEWREPTDHPQDGYEEEIVAVADGFGGRYSIRSERDGSFLLWWAHDNFLFLQCASVNGAKVAAEVDWQKRFRALMRPQPTGDTHGS